MKQVPSEDVNAPNVGSVATAPQGEVIRRPWLKEIFALLQEKDMENNPELFYEKLSAYIQLITDELAKQKPDEVDAASVGSTEEVVLGDIAELLKREPMDASIIYQMQKKTTVLFERDMDDKVRQVRRYLLSELETCLDVSFKENTQGKEYEVAKIFAEDKEWGKAGKIFIESLEKETDLTSEKSKKIFDYMAEKQKENPHVWTPVFIEIFFNRICDILTSEEEKQKNILKFTEILQLSKIPLENSLSEIVEERLRSEAKYNIEEIWDVYETISRTNNKTIEPLIRVVREKRDALFKKDPMPKDFRIEDLSQNEVKNDMWAQAQVKLILHSIYMAGKSISDAEKPSGEEPKDVEQSRNETEAFALKQIFSDKYNDSQRARVLAQFFFPKALRGAKLATELNETHVGSGGFFNYLLDNMAISQWSDVFNNVFMGHVISTQCFALECELLAPKKEVGSVFGKILEYDFKQGRAGAQIVFSRLVTSVPEWMEGKEKTQARRYEWAADILLQPKLPLLLKQQCFNALPIQDQFWVFQQVRKSSPILAGKLAGFSSIIFKNIMPGITYDKYAVEGMSKYKDHARFPRLRSWFQESDFSSENNLNIKKKKGLSSQEKKIKEKEADELQQLAAKCFDNLKSKKPMFDGLGSFFPYEIEKRDEVLHALITGEKNSDRLSAVENILSVFDPSNGYENRKSFVDSLFYGERLDRIFLSMKATTSAYNDYENLGLAILEAAIRNLHKEKKGSGRTVAEEILRVAINNVSVEQISKIISYFPIGPKDHSGDTEEDFKKFSDLLLVHLPSEKQVSLLEKKSPTVSHYFWQVNKEAREKFLINKIEDKEISGFLVGITKDIDELTKLIDALDIEHENTKNIGKDRVLFFLEKRDWLNNLKNQFDDAIDSYLSDKDITEKLSDIKKTYQSELVNKGSSKLERNISQKLVLAKNRVVQGKRDPEKDAPMVETIPYQGQKIWHIDALGTAMTAKKEKSRLFGEKATSAEDAHLRISQQEREQVYELMLHGVGTPDAVNPWYYSFDKTGKEVHTPSRIPKAVNQLVKKVTGRSLGTWYTFGTGKGEQQNIDRVMHQLALAEKNGQLPDTMVCTSYSRGIDPCIGIARAIYEKYGHSINVVMLLEDPVMGAERGFAETKRVIPPNVSSVAAFYSRQVDKPGYEPQDWTRLVGYDPSKTTITSISLPMDHSRFNPDAKKGSSEYRAPKEYMTAIENFFWKSLFAKPNDDVHLDPKVREYQKPQSIEEMHDTSLLRVGWQKTQHWSDFVKVTQGSKELPANLQRFHDRFRDVAFSKEHAPGVIEKDLDWDKKKKHLSEDTPEDRAHYLHVMYQHGLEKKARETLSHDRWYQAWLKGLPENTADVLKKTQEERLLLEQRLSNAIKKVLIQAEKQIGPLDLTSWEKSQAQFETRMNNAKNEEEVVQLMAIQRTLSGLRNLQLALAALPEINMANKKGDAAYQTYFYEFRNLSKEAEDLLHQIQKTYPALASQISLNSIVESMVGSIGQKKENPERQKVIRKERPVDVDQDIPPPQEKFISPVQIVEEKNVAATKMPKAEAGQTEEEIHLNLKLKDRKPTTFPVTRLNQKQRDSIAAACLDPKKQWDKIDSQSRWDNTDSQNRWKCEHTETETRVSWNEADTEPSVVLKPEGMTMRVNASPSPAAMEEEAKKALLLLWVAYREEGHSHFELTPKDMKPPERRKIFTETFAKAGFTIAAAADVLQQEATDKLHSGLHK